MKFVGSSLSAILAITRPAIGNAEIPQAPIIGLILLGLIILYSFAKRTPPAVSNTNATAPNAIIKATSKVKNLSADIVPPITIPNNKVTRLANSFCAQLERFSTQPATFRRLPNIKLPINATDIGATIPAITTIIIGNKNLVVLDTGSSFS